MRALGRWMARCAMVGLGATSGTARAGGWTHPVAGTVTPDPPYEGSQFGAPRGDGDRPEECGDGHCGVDLYGPRGLPIVSFADGWVVTVGRENRGASGRRVVVAHPGGAMTHYLHLDSIRPDLDVGRWVSSGEWLGTLGITGIHHSPPHLHFGLSIQSGGERVFIDPTPFLVLARLIEGPTVVSCMVTPATPRPLPPTLVRRSPVDVDKARRRAARRAQRAAAEEE